MSMQLNLKEIERKAFRATYQDGLWDMYLGLVVVSMAIFVYRPESGYSPLNIILAVLLIALDYSLFRAGKKYITQPRLGQVQFGAVRKQKKQTLAIILGVFVLIQVGLVGLTAFAAANPEIGAAVSNSINNRSLELLIVSAIGSLIVGTSMIVMAYFSDFPRGYYIATMMALGTFLMIYLNHPVYPIVIGGLIVLPGLALFVNFLKRYPLRRTDTANE